MDGDIWYVTVVVVTPPADGWGPDDVKNTILDRLKVPGQAWSVDGVTVAP